MLNDYVVDDKTDLALSRNELRKFCRINRYFAGAFPIISKINHLSNKLISGMLDEILSTRMLNYV